ncbi:MAG: hypothetical protein L3K26_09880 [Candidatus Hydrogenedentes bacterium]|nr:hypothetical protein [Candidatus Hydrogenedentota bacterium]
MFCAFLFCTILRYLISKHRICGSLTINSICVGGINTTFICYRLISTL